MQFRAIIANGIGGAGAKNLMVSPHLAVWYNIFDVCVCVCLCTEYICTHIGEAVRTQTLNTHKVLYIPGP